MKTIICILQNKGHCSAGSRRRFREEDGTGGELGGSEDVGESRPTSPRTRFSSRRCSCILHCSGVYSFLQPNFLTWEVVRWMKSIVGWNISIYLFCNHLIFLLFPWFMSADQKLYLSKRNLISIWNSAVLEDSMHKSKVISQLRFTYSHQHHPTALTVDFFDA